MGVVPLHWLQLSLRCWWNTHVSSPVTMPSRKSSSCSSYCVRNDCVEEMNNWTNLALGGVRNQHHQSKYALHRMRCCDCVHWPLDSEADPRCHFRIAKGNKQFPSPFLPTLYLYFPNIIRIRKVYGLIDFKIKDSSLAESYAVSPSLKLLTLLKTVVLSSEDGS
jgi:hypothetical protein